LVCGEDGAVTSFANFEDFELVLMRLEDNGEVRSSASFGNMPTATGGSLLTDPRTGDVLFVGVQGTSRMAVVRFSWDLELLGKETIYEVDDAANTVIYWPQAAMALEDRYLVSYVRQDAADGFVQDWGYIHVAVFDLDWNLLEDHRITDAPAPDGSMRPGLAVRDDTLIVSYDRIVGSPGLVQPRLRTVMLALDAFDDPEPPGDSGSSDSGTGSDTAIDDTAIDDTAVPMDSVAPVDTQDPGPGDSGGDGSRCGGCRDSTSPAPPAAAVLLFTLFPLRRRTRAGWKRWDGP
jgi:hypothetical protein